MSVAHSSQGFVRALKAPSDPPVNGGPFKIVIAQRAWDDVSFYVPSKSEVIVDWILNKIFKERGNEPSQNPVMDPQHWNLLYDILSSTNLSCSGITSRPLKSWLPTVLNRTPMAPILIRFLDLLGGLDHDLQNQLSQVFSSCFGILWPVAVQKIGIEALLECFSAVLSSLSLCETNDGIARVGGMVISSYRNSLWNSSNKKKIYLLFLQTHLALWLNGSLIEAKSIPHRLLLEVTYEAGIDTILNLDILRQARDSKSENMLFDAIATILSSNTTILITLPRILASYVQAVKKYRGSLFGQGSNQLPGATFDESNASGMRFFTACNSLLDHAGPTSQTWSTRVHLLSLVDRENIFARGQLDALLALNQNVELALNTLEDTQNAEHITFSTFAINSLSALTRIDYNFILPNLPRVLSAILMHKSSPAYLTFLNLLLSYHTKTRTMNAYVMSLLAALSPQPKSVVPGGAPAVYQRCHSGPLMDAAHLNTLSKAIYGFLTGTQASPTVRLVVDSLSQAWEQFYDAKGVSDGNDEPPRKKRKSIGGSTTVSQLDSFAIGLSLSARLSSIVISSLPLNSVPETTRQEIRESLSNLRNIFVSRSITKTFKRIRKTDEANDWGLQVTATAFLRLRYALNASRYLTLDPSADSKLSSKVQAILKSDGLLPELRVEIFRTLLDSTGSWDLAETRTVFDHILAYLAENLPGEDVCWSGNSYQLSFKGNGTGASSLALLHMVIERWLPVIESAALPTQLRTFIHRIIRINLDTLEAPNMPGLQTSSLLAQMLHSAQFWEHPNIRIAVLAFINEATLGLDEISNTSQISSVIPIYRLLLLFPMEYISRPNRADLIKRAITADLFVMHSLRDLNEATNDTLRTSTVLRIFLNRVFFHGGFTEQSVQQLCEYSRHMMAGDGAHKQHNIEFLSATTNLMELLFSELFQKSTTSNPESTPTLVTFLDEVQAGSLGLAGFQSRCIIQMIEVLEASFSLISFPQEIQDLLLTIYRKLSIAVTSQIQGFTGAGISTDLLGQRSSVMELWCALLIFGQWLSVTESPLPSLGRGFIVEAIKISTQHHVSSDACDTLLIVTSAILLQELHYVTETDCLPHLSLITASHLTFSEILSASGRTRMNTNLSRACKSLSPSHFSYILDLVGEGLTIPSTSEDSLAHLIELSILLLHNHPQGTLKSIQNHTTQCLHTFAGRSLFTEGLVSLRIQVLEFIVQHCSDRPAVLRLGDLNSIWTILARFLSGSQAHDNETSAGIFHKIVAVVGALVRLRRDLVTLTLPHLGVVLRQLLMSVRSVRPLLGSKQTTLITDTQPKWITSRSPLGAEEGKVLARLLETLTSKSIVRNNAMVTDTQKAESLAKPFSKHASYVLKAYIEAMNDPLCVLHSDLRKELQRGLYALCSMVSDHSRDAMMLSALDAGGKTTMKTLWKEYEKQKYVGKG